MQSNLNCFEFCYLKQILNVKIFKEHIYGQKGDGIHVIRERCLCVCGGGNLDPGEASITFNHCLSCKALVAEIGSYSLNEKAENKFYNYGRSYHPHASFSSYLITLVKKFDIRRTLSCIPADIFSFLVLSKISI